MGSYNSQYQSYYASIQKAGRGRQHTGRLSGGNKTRTLNKNLLMRRVLQELIGVFSLFLIVLICKAINTPQTLGFYNYCKNTVKYSFDYKALYYNVKDLDIDKLSSEVEDYIDKLKSGITGGKTIKETVSGEFNLPASGKIIKSYGDKSNSGDGENSFHYGVDISVPEGTEIKSCSTGAVKLIGEDEVTGKFILIDHGMGIETKYACLKDIRVNKNDEVKRGEVIALSGSSPESASTHLHFELMYMGENENPEEYINFVEDQK
ncbi:MAG: M23 family metallopeptidase [Bacillota bacterium]|nr:M23 family metallopeptidase [Bacillota bacterium]